MKTITDPKDASAFEYLDKLNQQGKVLQSSIIQIQQLCKTHGWDEKKVAEIIKPFVETFHKEVLAVRDEVTELQIEKALIKKKHILVRIFMKIIGCSI